MGVVPETLRPKHIIIILVVEDDAAARTSLEFALEVEGFAVRVYPGANEIFREGDLPRDSCLVLDYQTRARNGVELLTKLCGRGKPMPAIIATSDPSPRIHEQIASDGAALVEKPF